jgi:hypothetical protein
MKTIIRALSVLTVLFAIGFFMRFYMSFVQSPATAPIAAPSAVSQQPTLETLPPAVQSQPAEGPLTVASKAAISATNECRAKRISGELKTYVESVECSNPRIVEAWSAANYKYMDLVKSFAAKRLELARRVDRGELSEEQNQRQIAEFYSRLQAEERRRDGH